MSDLAQLTFNIATATLIGTWPLAFTASRLLARRAPIIKRCWSALFVGIIAAEAGAIALNIALWSYVANLCAVVVAYASLAMLATSAFYWKPRQLGALIGTLLSLPLAGGLLLGTFGMLVVAFVTTASAPVFTGSRPPNLQCIVTEFGNATTSVNGYSVTLKRPLALLPFLHEAIATESFNTFPPRDTPLSAAQACELATIPE